MLDETNDWPVGAVSVKAIDKPAANARAVSCHRERSLKQKILQSK